MRSKNHILTRFNDTAEAHKEYDMKILYHIDMDSKEYCKYAFPHRIRFFSSFIKDKVYAVLEDGSLHFCERA